MIMHRIDKMRKTVTNFQKRNPKVRIMKKHQKEKQTNELQLINHGEDRTRKK